MSYTTKRSLGAISMALVFCLSLVMSFFELGGITASAYGNFVDEVSFTLISPEAGKQFPAITGFDTDIGVSAASVQSTTWERLTYDENGAENWVTVKSNDLVYYSSVYRATIVLTTSNKFRYSEVDSSERAVIKYYLDTAQTNIVDIKNDINTEVHYDLSEGSCSRIIIKHTYGQTAKPNAIGKEAVCDDIIDPLATIPYGTSLADIIALANAHWSVNILTTASKVNTDDPICSVNVAVDWKKPVDKDGNDYNYTSLLANGKLTGGTTFYLRGQVTIPTNIINAPQTTEEKESYGSSYITVEVTVGGAERVEKPTATTLKLNETYTENNQVLKLTTKTLNTHPETKIYYYIAKSFKDEDLTATIPEFDPLSSEWEEYSNSTGIILTGTPDRWQKITVCAYATCDNMDTSDPAYFTYFLKLPAEEFGNIYSAYIEVQNPVAGQPLAREATIDPTNELNRGIDYVESVTWSDETESGRAKYNTRYTVTIILVPDSMHAFYSTPDVWVNGERASQATNTEGKLIVKYTFDYYTDRAKLTKVFSPDPMAGIANGTPLSDIRAKVYSMYSSIEVITEDSRGTLPVTWDFSDVDYDVNNPGEQTFYVPGKLTIPNDLDVAQGVETTVELAITVVPAGTTSVPYPVNWEFEYNHNPEIELVCDDPGSKIYYNIDGGTASPLDTLYTGQKIVLKGIEGQTVSYTLNVMATCPGKINSPSVPYTYTIRLPVAAPVPSIPGGRYSSNQTVELSTTTRNAEIYYTTDGTTPSASNGRRYSETGPIKVECDYGESVTVRIMAIAIVSGMPYSDIMDETYTVTREKGKCEMPYPDVAEGEYNLTSLKVGLSCDTEGATIRYNYTTDGTRPAAPTAASLKYNDSKPLSINGILGERVTLWIAAVAMKSNMNDSDIAYLKYTLYLPINTVPAPEFNLTDAQFTTYTTPQELKITCSDKDAEIFYTSDGITEPTSASRKYSDPIPLTGITGESVTYIIKAIAVKNGMKDSSVQTIRVRIEIPEPGPAVKSISIANKPLKTTYYLGDRLNLAGGRIKVTYTDNTVEFLDMTEDMIVWFDSTEVGFQPITVYYKGKRTEFSVTVIDPNADDPVKPNPPDDPNDPDGPNNPDDPTNPKDPTKPGNNEDIKTLPYIANTKTRGWDNIENRIRVTEQGTLVPIVLNDASYIPADIVNTASDREIILQLQVNNAIWWLIDTGAIYGSVANVSVGMKTDNIYIPDVLINGAGGRESIRFHTYGTNKLNAEINVKTGAQKGMFANLYRYNTAKRKLEFVDCAKITNGGYASLTPTLSGDYVIMVDSTTALPGDMNDNTRIDANDAAMILKAIVSHSLGSSLKGDFNGDGKVNALDAAAILRRVVGLAL